MGRRVGGCRRRGVGGQQLALSCVLLDESEVTFCGLVEVHSVVSPEPLARYPGPARKGRVLTEELGLEPKVSVRVCG